MKDYQRPLGEAIRKARLGRHLTQAGVARQLGIDTRTVLNIENGKANPKLEVLYPLIRFLRINPQEIFYPEHPQDNPVTQKMQRFLGDCSEAELEALLPMCEYFITALRTKEKLPQEEE